MAKFEGDATVTHKVGMCPACRAYLWAEVDLVTTVSPPTLTDDGKCSVYASTKAVAMRVSHECPTPTTDAPEETTK